MAKHAFLDVESYPDVLPQSLLAIRNRTQTNILTPEQYVISRPDSMRDWRYMTIPSGQVISTSR